MLKFQTKEHHSPRNIPARSCDTCRTAASAVYCRADSAYLCTSCDARIHTANQVASRHERLPVCESCCAAPAAFLCKADAASLCAACDSEVHSANPLSRRHHRVPVKPIHGPESDRRLVKADEFKDVDDDEDEDEDEGEDEDETASWLLLNPDGSGGSQLFGDDYLELDFEEYRNSCNQLSGENQQYSSNFCEEKSYGGDRVVPIQYHFHHHHLQQNKGKEEQVLLQNHSFHLGLDYEHSNINAYAYPTSAMSQNVSLSPIDVGVVPESTMNEASNNHQRPPKGTIDLFSGPPIQLPTQLNPMDREARVMRYREKKKTRKFEKTIRYASRKAYAETRPRIKGRFAKRTDVEVEVDQMFSATFMAEAAYGVVPSF